MDFGSSLIQRGTENRAAANRGMWNQLHNALDKTIDRKDRKARQAKADERYEKEWQRREEWRDEDRDWQRQTRAEDLALKREMQAFKRDNDVDALFFDAMLAKKEGRELTPRHQAAIGYKIAENENKTVHKYNPTTGYSQASTAPNPYKSMFPELVPQSMGELEPQPVRQSASPMESGPQSTFDKLTIDVEPLEQTVPKGAMSPDPYYDNAPKTRMDAAKKRVDVEGDIAKQKALTDMDLDKYMAEKDYDNAIKVANESLKTERGQKKVLDIVDRMTQLNDELKEAGAIVAADNKMGTNLMARGRQTGLGQGLQKVLSPEVQAKIDEYTKLQSSLLPFYASASGLGAKSLDSDGERKAILSSFGDPVGIYDANDNQLNNLRQLFGGDPRVKVQDGQTATNPTTGEKIIFKDGKWEKL